MVTEFAFEFSPRVINNSPPIVWLKYSNCGRAEECERDREGGCCKIGMIKEEKK